MGAFFIYLRGSRQDENAKLAADRVADLEMMKFNFQQIENNNTRITNENIAIRKELIACYDRDVVKSQEILALRGEVAELKRQMGHP